MLKLRAASFAAIVATPLSAAPVYAEALPAPVQAAVEEVARKFAEVTHVDTATFDELTKGGGVVLFDTRTAEEFAVSHLDGAILTDPKISPEEFLAKHAAELKGKTAIFYCSVGMRSSRVASRVAPGLKDAGAEGIASLKGGIFAWAHAGRPLVNASGPTAEIHGYDKSWGKLIERK